MVSLLIHACFYFSQDELTTVNVKASSMARVLRNIDQDSDYDSDEDNFEVLLVLGNANSFGKILCLRL